MAGGRRWRPSRRARTNSYASTAHRPGRKNFVVIRLTSLAALPFVPGMIQAHAHAACIGLRLPRTVAVRRTRIARIR